MKRRAAQSQDGSIVVSILMVTIFLVLLVSSLAVLANANVTRARNRILLLQAQYAAESGADAAIAMLNNSDAAYAGTAGAEVQVLLNAQYKSTYAVTVTAGADSKEKIITATGKVYAPANASTARLVRNIEVVAQRTAGSNGSSLMSRNILEVASSVKTISAIDIMLNGYINLNKNTTDLVAENITVGGKITGAQNCSIGGSGSLKKPTTFTHAGQTKTNLTLAYNNCLTPPGNTSNSDFNVSVNQTTINRIQSTYIPWSQYMDNTYQNSPGGCADWTTGTFPRSIPSTGNTKKTHYPDSGGGVSTSCGTNGDLSLGTGQYNIKDHVHLRANLCTSSACKPTFYNPDAGMSGLKFVFVEGTVNFDQVTTASGSGPIVIVSYGSDPAAKAGDCPYGGAVFLGNGGNTSAPALYLLANNGLCLYQTKFDSLPALGGVSGKNIYISTNSGTPFDLGLDPAFPSSSIPVDLAWRAARYRRL